MRDVREVAGLLQRAVLAAHADIVRGYAADVFQAGTACLVGKNKEKNTHTLCFLNNGILKKAGLAVLPCGENEMQHGACLVAVGNVHAFLVRAATGVVLELTAGSLSGAKNPNDTCGRLGPYVDGGDPDLRNLQRYFCECREGDWIWLVTDSVVRNCDVAALLDASPLSGSRVLRACEERTAELRGFLAASPSAAAPPHLSGVLDHATALGLCVGRPPVAAALAEGGVEAPLSGAEGLPGAAELRWSEADWSRVFVCLPPYAAATGPRLEVRAQLLTVAVPDAQHGVLRPRAIGWLALTEGMSRKQLSRWLSRTISTSMQQQQQQQQQQSAQPQLQQSSNSSDLLRDLVPERDTLQLLGRGRTATDRFGVVISDVVVEVIGRDNSLIATRRLVLAASPDPARVKEFLNSLPASFRPIPSVFDFAQSFLVPSAEKYK